MHQSAPRIYLCMHCHWNIFLCVFSVPVTPPRSWEWNLACSDETVTLLGWDTDLKDQKCWSACLHPTDTISWWSILCCTQKTVPWDWLYCTVPKTQLRKRKEAGGTAEWLELQFLLHHQEKGEHFLFSTCRIHPREAIPSLHRYSVSIKLLLFSAQASSYSRAFLSLLKFYISTWDMLRNGLRFKRVFNIKWRLKSFAARSREGCFVCSVPCPVWEDIACLLLSSKEPFCHFRGLIWSSWHQDLGPCGRHLFF